jgi:hypothetical protein
LVGKVCGTLSNETPNYAVGDNARAAWPSSGWKVMLEEMRSERDAWREQAPRLALRKHHLFSGLAIVLAEARCSVVKDFAVGGCCVVVHV